MRFSLSRSQIVFVFIGFVLSMSSFAAPQPGAEVGLVIEVKGDVQLTANGKKSKLEAFSPLVDGATIELKQGAEIHGTRHATATEAAKSFRVKGPSTIQIKKNDLKVLSGQAIEFSQSKSKSAKTEVNLDGEGGFNSTGPAAGAVRMRSVISSESKEPKDSKPQKNDE